MTTITHTLVGATIGAGYATLMPETCDCTLSPFGWVLLCIGLSNLPDVDMMFLVTPKRWRRTHRYWDHRGITHGLPACVFFSLAIPSALGYQVGTPQWQCLSLLFGGVIALHLICDCMDGSTGICLLAPFSPRLFTTGYKLNKNMPLDVLSTADGRMAFLYGVMTETMLITAPAAGIVGTLTYLRRTL